MPGALGVGGNGIDGIDEERSGRFGDPAAVAGEPLVIRLHIRSIECIFSIFSSTLMARPRIQWFESITSPIAITNENECGD